MDQKSVIIDDKIFEIFPDFRRGIVIVEDMNNRLESPEVKTLLDEVIHMRTGGDNRLEHDFVKAWDETYRKFNVNPNKYPPSIKSLIKRVQKGGKIPFINSVVALFNYVSIKYLIPCGGDDIDTIKGNLRLGFASGSETFVPLGGKEQEHPVEGEVIYFDDATLNVMCRRWNWRNGDFSKIMEGSKRVVINIDGIGPVPDDTILKARDEIVSLLEEYCDAHVNVAFLKEGEGQISIS